MIILRIEDIKSVCADILTAVDSNGISKITETLEIVVDSGTMNMNVTNGDYYARVTLPVTETNEKMHATVDAALFLKLISKTTTDTVQIDVNDNILTLCANGNYKIPLIYDGDELLKLPEINIENETNSFDIESSVLKDIMIYNTKELQKGLIAKPVQKLYYIDEKGAITFTTGACVNDFSLPEPVKLLLNQKIVKLFKIFKDEAVKFTIGQDMFNNMTQTKVKFTSSNFELTAVIPSDDSMVNSVPVDAIRDRAHTIYPYSVVINKSELLQTIERLLLFSSDSLKLYSKFEFGVDSVKIYDIQESNYEVIKYSNEAIDALSDPYVAILDLIDLKLSLEGYNESHSTIRFGNNVAIVVYTKNIHTVIPEVNQ